MDCYFCDEQAVQECARCGALYCDEHGDALCQRCLDPAQALPSHRVYRGSLVALLAGTVFAVWLLVKPPSTGDADSPLPASISGVRTSAGAAIEASPPPSVKGAAAPAGQAAGPPPAATPAAPIATATPKATATPTFVEHRVGAGDTLSSIAARYQPPGKPLADFISEIQKANGITDPGSIVAGQTIRIPQ
jgi:LysM repeat protein